MNSIRILVCLLLVAYNHGDTSLAFPSIQQQLLQQSNGKLLSITLQNPTTAGNDSDIIQQQRSPNHHQIWNHHKPYVLLHISLRSGGGNIHHTTGSYRTSILGRYSRFVDEQPLLAKSMTAGIVTTMANIFSQIVVASQSQSITMNNVLSWRRVILYMITGLCFIGPYLHVWYGYLDRVLAMPKQKHTTRTVTKVIVDQTIGLCIFFPLYFTFIEVTESILLGRVPMILSALAKCRTDFIDIAMMNWRIWPLTNIINFGIIPMQLRVLVNQIVSFFWFAYLSTRV